MIITRRTLFGLIAAPAIIKVIDLMPIKALAAAPFEWDFGTDSFTVEAWVKSDEWAHLAVDRADGNLNFYMNGTKVPYDAKRFHPLAGIAPSRGSSALMFNTGREGVLDEVRVTRGVARYAIAKDST